MNPVLEALLYGDVLTEVVHCRRPRVKVPRTRCNRLIYPPLPDLPLMQVTPSRFYISAQTMRLIRWRFCERCWPDQDEDGVPLEFKR